MTAPGGFWIAPGQSSQLARTGAYRPAKKVHQPEGLIGPSTSVQADGGWNWRHLSQRDAPIGDFW
jgi:hypothetical protein